MADTRTFHEAIDVWAAGGPGDPARELAARLGVRAAVLLEGRSDVAALDALAAGRGRDLAAEGICAVSMGGATNVGHYTRVLGPEGLGLRLTGLCDERERPHYARCLDERDLFVCVADLEDELIRALGVARVRELAEREGESRVLRTFLNQPAQRDRTPRQQLRRFIGTKAGRKIHYGRALVEALPPAETPAPLAALLAAL
ncbi:TOPRIM nucleotidyl transferase/hydrolase domain-containing protein [Streptomyces fradiae]|uniref:TOPRIM nucleotidyl transferase/hydrolase domain-containing protein n=1 Tax=Streptomyces fradiae TaxID=1906 RepID=UPI0029438A79|nr:TOPRIM nucleotidyl transferase/hydrolase domain-containing protein [Streptomyces fradiae]WOI61815.1 TOPRIM nucleotidyl transferase/hydrolase domain-containing protein [Streptomyces fradiae]